ncbi:Glycosyl transferase, group 1 [Candidatus Methylomirabilis lanthanidiphila]|uniref:Glycosyl transferase, group 1 n=1 Tax=Candidatus Methylomirabilis lanthanidiphila TaxID=2211376 RepID=A0A564ZJ53_9BACT|nr:glycosyltransferase [Candidatus Methylomirabilis lanthanidiphila]VUZ85324.1 Glycosyl transferase, group 1 [Candidatus Methylomirabilis lanthanidiphila]
MVNDVGGRPDGVIRRGAQPAEKAVIALVVASLRGGGAPRQAVILANAFAARGQIVHLVVIQPEGALRSAVAPCVRLVSLESRMLRLPLVRSNRRLQVVASIPPLVRYLRHERPDVLVAAASHVHRAAIWARCLARTETRLVLRASNHLSRSAWNTKRWPRPLLPVFARLFYPWADGFIANSEGIADDLSRVAGIPRERITVIPNPVVTPELKEQACVPLDHPWYRPGQPPVILGVGRLTTAKDFPTLLHAFARLRATRRVRLIILGEGKGRSRLTVLAEQLGIAADLELPGWMDNPYRYMARSAVFVLSSAWEGLPNALIEAMACGCPVVSTDCPGGAAEILQGGVYGPLVPVGDDAALAEAIASVLDNPPERERPQTRARYYSADLATERYLQILLGVAGISQPHEPESESARPGADEAYAHSPTLLPQRPGERAGVLRSE